MIFCNFFHIGIAFYWKKHFIETHYCDPKITKEIGVRYLTNCHLKTKNFFNKKDLFSCVKTKFNEIFLCNMSVTDFVWES